MAKTCQHLHELSLETHKTVDWINQSHYGLRIAIYALIVVIVSLMIWIFTQFKLEAGGLNLADFIQMLESALNGTILISAGIIF